VKQNLGASNDRYSQWIHDQQFGLGSFRNDGYCIGIGENIPHQKTQYINSRQDQFDGIAGHGNGQSFGIGIGGWLQVFQFVDIHGISNGQHNQLFSDLQKSLNDSTMGHGAFAFAIDVCHDKP
jgi:hypothetical protein